MGRCLPFFETQYFPRLIGAGNLAPVLQGYPDYSFYELSIGFGQNTFGIVYIIFQADPDVATHSQRHHGHRQMTLADPDDGSGGVVRNVFMQVEE